MRQMRYLRMAATSGVVLGLCFGGLARAAEYVWWEGESAAETNFPARTWFAASTFKAKRDKILSAGDWLTSDGKRSGAEAFAKYRIHVPGAGEYNFWVRKFWTHGPFRWRFDRAEWRICGRDIALADNTPIRRYVCVNWVSLGKVRLTRGPHDFELRLLAEEGEKQTACFDCFLLTPHAFIPRGKLKPDEKSGLAMPGFWAFEPECDPFGDAALNLRGLNEKVAGESGFVRRQGDRFRLGNGRPVRFWGVNCGPGVVKLNHDSQLYLARRLAKVGVNMVRIHGPLFSRRADATCVDAKYLGQLHAFVAAMKGQGIYVTLSFYFPLWFRVKPDYGIPGYQTIRNKKPFALLFFDPRMQEIYKTWARALLLTPNPHTRMPLARDPGVAIVEIVNEDSYLFWTFSEKNIPRVQLQKLENLFGDWLKAKYGSIGDALAAWGGTRLQRDDPDRGVMTLLGVWHLTARGVARGGRRRRMSDQLRFLVEHQKRFYENMIRFFRKEIGTRSLISCSNWKTADPVILDALERYTYAAGDIIDRHGYFSGRHEGKRARYAVDRGDSFADRAGVLEPHALPVHVNQVVGYPHIISEIGWPNPNRFKAECPFLCAACGSLQGIDGFFFFSIGGPGWDASPRKFPVSVPTVLGQFPAAALLYRRGDLREADVVVREILELDGLYRFKGSAVREPQNLDALRAADVPPGGALRGKGVTRFDPLAFGVGRVTRAFGRDRSKALLRDLTKYIDRDRKLMRSVTGELTWNYGTGLVTIETPKSQGAAGFLGRAGRIELRDVVIESRNEFGVVLIISLDGKALASSGKVLVQAMTEEEPYGWQVRDGRITDLGSYPMNVRNIDAAVTLKRQDQRRTIHFLDTHGYIRGSLEPTRTDTGLKIQLPADAIYTMIH